LIAFKMDQVKPEYESWEELLEYSHYSANPVGRLVLGVCGYREETIALLSDKVCTALQLANFWQDVVEDEERGRRYLPAESLRRFDVDEGQIQGRIFTPEFGAMIKDLVDRTRSMLHEGGQISRHVDRELAVTLNLFRKGGDAILDGIVEQDYDVLRGRPVVSKTMKLRLLGGSLIEKLRAGMVR
jgi:phytoene/squalene synthetase